MAVIAIYSPGELSTGTSNTTQYVANPFASPGNPASTVWIECDVQPVNIWDTAAFVLWGIIEYEYMDSNGNIQQASFGDVNNLSNSSYLPTRMGVVNMVSVTLAFITVNVAGQCRVVLSQWG